jgi:hypothetical protein
MSRLASKQIACNLQNELPQCTALGKESRTFRMSQNRTFLKSYYILVVDNLSYVKLNPHRSRRPPPLDGLFRRRCSPSVITITIAGQSSMRHRPEPDFRQRSTNLALRSPTFEQNLWAKKMIPAFG